jgi:hypothetical protein
MIMIMLIVIVMMAGHDDAADDHDDAADDHDDKSYCMMLLMTMMMKATV